MQIKTLVSLEMYNTYLAYKFSTRGLPFFLKPFYILIHYFKNTITNYKYPREYIYLLSENGIAKNTGQLSQLYSWDLFDSLIEVSGNIAFLKEKKLVLYMYTGVEKTQVTEFAKRYLN